MVVYMYLAILIVTSIITGIIVTIMERKGFYPKKDKTKKTVKNEVKTEDPVIMSAVTVMNMKPIEVEDYDNDISDSPVLLSSYTVDLSDVVNKAKTAGCV